MRPPRGTLHLPEKRSAQTSHLRRNRPLTAASWTAPHKHPTRLTFPSFCTTVTVTLPPSATSRPHPATADKQASGGENPVLLLTQIRVQAPKERNPLGKEILKWEDMTPKELTALITEALTSVREGNAALQDKINALTADRDQLTATRASARQTELEAKRKVIEDELKAIADKTWTGAFTSPEPPSNTQLTRHGGRDRTHKKTARFDPSLLPKFKAQDDLEQWISEIQIDINVFVEQLVCPLIWRHCFQH